MEDNKKLTGIGFSCICSVLCAIAISRNGTPDAGIFLWLVFVVGSGCMMDIRDFTSKKQMYLYSLIPTLTLMLTMLIIPFLWSALGYKNYNLDLVLNSIKFVLPLMAVFTPLFLCLSGFSRDKFILMMGASEETCKKWNRTANLFAVITPIVVTIAGYFTK